ncbi:hypothetical protein [Citrobacter freundii]|uniref:hypothetical protein n=1 Tax=Citrobacter freundii TaxID=546 RepID=UPI00200F67C7|nr:hypothetical protein [Citrobacter freundii]UQI34186.1 hypothetical protein M3L74_13070 [Citrobacter freundii]
MTVWIPPSQSPFAILSYPLAKLRPIWTIKAMQVLERSVLTAQWPMKLEVDNRLAHPFHQRSAS